MFQLWRQKIREAEAAYRSGQLEEAGQLLQRDNLREFKPGRRLAVKIAAGMAQRARGQAALGDTHAGWRDLKAAAALQGESDAVRDARESLCARGLAEAERFLAAGEYHEALAQLGRLERRDRPTAATRVLRQVIVRVQSAGSAADEGRFAEAADHLAAAAALRPDLAWFPAQREACTLKAEQYRQAADELHGSLAAEAWPAVLTTVEAMLALAPACPVALAARQRAWQAMDLRGGPRAARAGAVANQPEARRPLGEESRTVDTRFVLWIDAVGGILVCPGDEIVIGRPAAGSLVHVPILADLSRRHAVIRRDGESYLLDPVRSTKIDGRVVQSLTSLSDGNVIELGSGVEMRFRRPHPLSGTARLEMISGHRTEPHVDAVLLMAESCVLGPAWHNHVVCRPWLHDVVLFRQSEELHCRYQGTLLVDGQEHKGTARIAHGMQVEGEDFSFSLESAG